MNNKKVTKTKFDEFLAILKNKKVIIAIVTTIALLVLFRIGSVIPMPFIKIKENVNHGSFLQMVNLLGGGGLNKVSIFAIGISPYITAQIVMQLLSSELIPPLSRLAKSGERGRKKIEVYTRILTLPLSGIQSYAILALLLNNQNSFATFSNQMPFAIGSPLFYFFFITLMIAGTYIAIFLGDLITKRGVGNGVTLIILAGILSSLFNQFQTVFITLKTLNDSNNNLLTGIIAFIVYIICYILILFAVIFINGSVRKIPVQQVGQSLASDESQLYYLPIKINAVGVIPVIFASSIMTIPSTIAQFLSASDPNRAIIENYVSLNSISGIAIYFVLIIFFTFFYSYVQLNPQKIADDFKKSGRFVPGIKMGRDTEKHITKTLYRINWIGAPFLAIIASIPYIVSYVSKIASDGAINIPSGAALGGTGIVIMVSATIDLWQSIKSTATTTSYSYQKRSIESIISDENKNNDASQLW